MPYRRPLVLLLVILLLENGNGTLLEQACRPLRTTQDGLHAPLVITRNGLIARPSIAWDLGDILMDR